MKYLVYIAVNLFFVFASYVPGSGFGTTPGAYHQAQEKSSDSAQAKKILQSAIAAMGGLEKVGKIRSFRIKTQNTLSLTQKDLLLIVTETVLLPDRTKQVMELPAGVRTQVLNGNRGWRQIGGSVSDLSATEQREMQRGLFRDTIHLYQMGEAGQLKLEYYGEEVLGGKRLLVLHISTDRGDYLNLYIDSQTFLPAKKTYQGSVEVGLATLEESYSDYRDVDGIKVPFHTLVKANGKKFIESKVIEANFNVKIAPEFFLKSYAKP
ncbi:MAG: hypothetical protein ACE5HO_04425 [bacterium]